MKRSAIVLFIIVIAAGVAIEQTAPSAAVSQLGPHNLGGRGCQGCHTPTLSSPAVGESAIPPLEAASQAPWGPATLPLYGKTFTFGDNGRYVEVLPATVSIHDREVDGILVCLSCHDGNLVPPSMMVGQSYEQRIGLLPANAYGGAAIPTLLGADSYANDHPVGTQAVISTGDGLVWANNTFIVIPGSRYAQFVANYGRPALVPGRLSNPWGVSATGQPFVLCITCHNQHMMTAYASSQQNQIANDGGGKSYPTFFFVNGPYNPLVNPNIRNTTADSTAQFCRQCHFRESNEANNSNTVPTLLQSY